MNKPSTSLNSWLNMPSDLTLEPEEDQQCPDCDGRIKGTPGDRLYCVEPGCGWGVDWDE